MLARPLILHDVGNYSDDGAPLTGFGLCLFVKPEAASDGVLPRKIGFRKAPVYNRDQRRPGLV
jgi:hypothetical protein